MSQAVLVGTEESWHAPSAPREHIWCREGEKLHVGLHAGQQRAHACPARIVLLLTGHQAGKTCYEPIWQLREIERRGDGDHFASSATYDLLDLKMLPQYRALFRDELGWEYRASRKTLTSPNGRKRIIFRSADAPAGLESATILSAVLDEWGQPQIGVEEYEAIRRRASIYQARILVGTTPYCMGWLKVEIHDRAVGGDPSYGLVSFTSTENPWFPRGEYEQRKREMPAWRFAMFYDGVFTKPAGLIYTDFEDGYATFEPVVLNGQQMPGPGRYVEGGNLVRAFTIPHWWLRDLGVDFGPVNTGILWSAEDPVTRNLYAYRESLGELRTGPEHARSILEYGEPIRRALGGSGSESDARQEWSEAGVGVEEPPVGEVEAGIDRATVPIKSRRFFVFDTLVKLRAQFGTYSRELDAAGEPTAKIAEKERFHLMDAYRYLASGWPLAKLPEAKEEKLPDLRSVETVLGPPRREPESY